MAEFNAMDTAAFKGVWVFCEQREGQVQQDEGLDSVQHDEDQGYLHYAIV